MPLLVISLVVIGLCFCCFVIYFKIIEKEITFEKRGFIIGIFVLSLITLLISLGLFWNMGVYADLYGSSPVLVSGGWFWLYMDWLRLGLLLILCIISGSILIRRSK